jgi:hypothetical protein
MTDDNTSPFVPGARVAIQSKYTTHGYTEGFVDKVHKPRGKYSDYGNITLKGSAQQYRVSRSRGFGDDVGMRWGASSTGDEWRHTFIYPWDAKIEKEIAEQRESNKRQRRINRLEQAVKAMHRDNKLLDGFLDTIEEFELYDQLAPVETKVA